MRRPGRLEEAVTGGDEPGGTDHPFWVDVGNSPFVTQDLDELSGVRGVMVSAAVAAANA
jgi:hypothetical protein